MIVCLFAHTGQGSAALRELLEAGVPREDLRVIGDLGPAAGAAGAERHVTLDAVHLPVAERELFMDAVRGGGGVLAVEWAGVEFVEEVARKHGAVKTLQVSAAGVNPSHNVG